jgi:hypothetical protein
MGHVDSKEDSLRRKRAPSLPENQINLFLPAKVEKAVCIDNRVMLICGWNLKEGLYCRGELGNMAPAAKIFCDTAKPLGKAKKLGSTSFIGLNEKW